MGLHIGKRSQRALMTVLFASASVAGLAACGGGGGGTGGTGGTGTGPSSSSAATTTSSSSSGGTTTSSSSGGTTSSSSSSSTSTSSSSSSGALALCTNPPPNTAPQINDQYTTAAMPAMGTGTGGPIASGTYFMTAITNYQSSSTGGTHKDTMVIDTAAATMVDDEVNGGKVKPTMAGTIATSGHTLTLNLACPIMASASFEYTFAGGTLTIYDYNSKSVSVWTKQ